ncbi:MAG: 23S rRNA (guanosine(2251)-2'-O)-methyltransferase RlmB [bacterium]
MEARAISVAGLKIPWERLVVGVHPLELAADAGLLEFAVAAGDDKRAEIARLFDTSGVKTRRIERAELDNLELPDGHQNVFGAIRELPNQDPVEAVPESGRALVVLLDGITDPRNAGAIVRSAAAVGASAVVLPSHRSAQPGPVFYKASAGLAFKIPICRGRNLSQVLDELARRGFWSVAAAACKDSSSGRKFKFPERCALVLGGEDKGIRQKLAGHCDHSVSIPMVSGIESLNVAVAAGILAYKWAQDNGVFEW